jgi:hypothetical protein
VSVDTAQPSRPLSLMSSAMLMKGGSAFTYLQQQQQQRGLKLEMSANDTLDTNYTCTDA